MSTWFYAQKDGRLGPVSVETLQELARNGEITATTLVWREGMGDWVKFTEVSNDIFTTQTVACAHSGRIFEKSEMLQYGNAWIAPEFKDAYLQRIMESGSPVAGDTDWNQGQDYVGFWWRVLAMLVDGLVMIIPSVIISIPYYIISHEATSAAPENPFAGMTGDATVPYILTTLGTLILRMGYEVWMVGKFQGTVGKMAIGAKVVAPDGGRISYKRSFLRWLGKSIINSIVIYTIALIPAAIGFALNFEAIQEGTMTEEQTMIAIGLWGSLCSITFLIGCFPFYMAGFTKQKQALHDLMFATRVVKKD